MLRFAASSVLLLVAVGCRAPDDVGDTDVAGPAGLPLLGGYQHTTDAVDLTSIRIPEFDDPTDLAFHPDFADEVWITDRGDDSMVIVDEVSTEPVASVRTGEDGQHFLAHPAALAFGKPGFLATAQDTDDKTQMQTPDDFMGPTLWTSDPNEFDGGMASHYDMLHDSPDGAGIAWDHANVYWVFDGYHDAIARYDFKRDHGAGGTDHSDGVMARYVEGEVKYARALPSHLVLDHDTGLLYVADTGNSRIAVLDTATGTRGASITPNYDDDVQYEMDGADLRTFADASTADGIDDPVGIELEDGVLYVSDAGTATILAFTLDGELVDWLPLGLPSGALRGITFDADGALWAIDADSESLIRVRSR